MINVRSHREMSLAHLDAHGVSGLKHCPHRVRSRTEYKHQRGRAGGVVKAGAEVKDRRLDEAFAHLGNDKALNADSHLVRTDTPVFT